MDIKTTTQYYTFDVSSSLPKFHATVDYRVFGKNKQGNSLISIQTVDETFLLQAGTQNEYLGRDETTIPKLPHITISKLKYLPKCSLEEYFARGEDWKFAYHIFAALQFIVRIFPEGQVIRIRDQLSFDPGSYRTEYLYYYLSYFSLIQFKKTWFEYYLCAFMDADSDLEELNHKPDGFVFLSGGPSPFADSNIIDTYMDEYNKAASVQDFLKGKNLATFGHPWLTWYMHNIARFGGEAWMYTSKIWNMKRLIGEIEISDTPFIEKPLNYFDYHIMMDASDKSIIVQNDFIPNTILGMGDVDWSDEEDTTELNVQP